jgi:hypothetical protein
LIYAKKKKKKIRFVESREPKYEEGKKEIEERRKEVEREEVKIGNNGSKIRS